MNWVCSQCGSNNGDELEFCMVCDAKRPIPVFEEKKTISNTSKREEPILVKKPPVYTPKKEEPSYKKTPPTYTKKTPVALDIDAEAISAFVSCGIALVLAVVGMFVGNLVLITSSVAFCACCAFKEMYGRTIDELVVWVIRILALVLMLCGNASVTVKVLTTILLVILFVTNYITDFDKLSFWQKIAYTVSLSVPSVFVYMYCRFAYDLVPKSIWHVMWLAPVFIIAASVVISLLAEHVLWEALDDSLMVFYVLYLAIAFFVISIVAVCNVIFNFWIVCFFVLLFVVCVMAAGGACAIMEEIGI